MMYKSQFEKIDPYDWFCGPELIYKMVQQKEWADNLTELWNCVLSIFTFAGYVFGFHALQMKQQKLN